MRRLRTVIDWDILKPSPVSGSILCAVGVDSAGYEFVPSLKGKQPDTKPPAPSDFQPIRQANDLANPIYEIGAVVTDLGNDRFIEGPFLVPRRMPVHTRKGVNHDPLALEGLHVEFAALNSASSIERFANRYGCLGYGYCILESGVGDRLAESKNREYGESFGHWMHHIAHIRLIRMLWHLIDAGEELTLRTFVTRSHSRPFSREAYAVIGISDTLPHISFSPVAEGDTDNEAFEYEDYEVDVSASQVAYWSITDILRYELRQSMRIAVLPGDPNFYVIVMDLLGALYWHLFRELSGMSANVRLCQFCSTLIQDARTDAKFCSADCRQKAFQLRKKKVNQS